MPPPPNFTATCLQSEDMGEYQVLSLADDEKDPGDYLIFQRAHEFTKQDIRLGMNAVHVERNGQGWSGYGGLRRVTLTRQCLTLELDEHGADFMDGTPFMRVDLDLPFADYTKLGLGLRVCFAGMPFFVDEVGLG